jgi:hypothetical protein
LRLLGKIRYGLHNDFPNQNLHERVIPDTPLARELARDQAENIRHEAIEVPKGKSPLSEESLPVFVRVLQEVVDKNIIPHGYGLLECEWEEGGYPLFEVIHRGRKKKEIQVNLPLSIWFPRARLWVQSLNVLSHFLNM